MKINEDFSLVFLIILNFPRCQGISLKFIHLFKQQLQCASLPSQLVPALRLTLSALIRHVGYQL